METVRGKLGLGIVAAALFAYSAMVMLPVVYSKRINVGGSNTGWKSGVNCTKWANHTTFYIGDWLYFGYDLNQASVLEVNKTAYENCITGNPMHNYTRGGRDVVLLNVTGTHYFISDKGACYSGLKMAIDVQNVQPPTPSPIEKSEAFRFGYTLETLITFAFAIAGVGSLLLGVC